MFDVIAQHRADALDAPQCLTWGAKAVWLYGWRIAEEGDRVNRSQLVRTVSESTLSSRRAVEDTVEALFGVIISEVRSGRKVTVVGFGSFNPIDRGPRVGRNPRTGAVVPIPASKGVRFATGSAFKSALNPKEGEAMAVKKAVRKRSAKKAPARKTAARKSTAKRTTKRAPARKRTAKKAPARKTTGRKRAAKKSTARKSTARKSTAKRTAKKSPARKRTAKKAPARKRTAKKSPARKRTAKKAPARKTAARKS